jgi:hypothetical protein
MMKKVETLAEYLCCKTTSLSIVHSLHWNSWFSHWSKSAITRQVNQCETPIDNLDPNPQQTTVVGRKGRSCVVPEEESCHLFWEANQTCACLLCLVSNSPGLFLFAGLLLVSGDGLEQRHFGQKI